ncbi:MAG: Rieske 2Fe-2S domain-containing protein [Zoogloeaceae bacterium]|nr:Rieske 2Fe-2S domain-containing protein [Zoogloeaceae bacterium]MCP5241133.1 Rieske 2Fe-2S domain-containing protein [Zoogloeaceae bacterium]MCP5254937.1 Rieske 2Fe-2S domain-containing protein [Zoogloeaceae bacterium]
MNSDRRDKSAGCGAGCDEARRAALKICAGAVIGMVASPRDNAFADDPTRAHPQAGDRLVRADADSGVNTPLDLASLAVGDKPLIAYPFDPATRTVRDGSRLNRVLLIRLDPAGFDERTRARAAEGVLAYSAVCTHQGCDVTEYNPTENVLFCFCHFSKFQPAHGGEVVGGPAPRNLPLLPLRLEGGQLVVADTFTSRPGATL